jgi:hypothetical protein
MLHQPQPKLRKQARRQTGQAMVVLGLVLSVFLVLVLGLFGFEIHRIELAREQLRAACDAASLSAAATLASSDNLNPTLAHTTAINTALTTFRENLVIGTALSAASQAASTNDVPSADQALLFFEFLDPHNNNAVVPLGDSRGKIIKVDGTFGLVPAFGKFLGINSTPVRTTSWGGVPNLDVVLCFDVSASIDDQTPVTFVKRQWDAGNGKVIYTVVSTSAGAPAGALAQGKIFDILGPPATGSSVNALPPQQLTASNNGQSTYPLTFSERSLASAGLRGATNAGSPPGNYPPGTAGTGTARTYTDLVVNLDGKDIFAGVTTADGFAFPDLATVVEAARGNLEDDTVFTNSKANTGVPVTITAKAGYKAAYLKLAAANVHPLSDAQFAGQDFLTIMNTNTDAHFSIVTFTTDAGTSATDTYNTNNVDSTYGAGGNGSFPTPMIALNSTDGQTNYSTCSQALPTTVAISSTNIGDAVNTAVAQLKNNSRAGSKKAIVVFTDGQPTAGGPLDSDPWTNARKAASKAKTEGIPIYSIGLAQNAAIIPGETAILNDTNPDATSGGISAIAGNGGKFFLVTKVEDLRFTFENIARQLVQLVK